MERPTLVLVPALPAPEARRQLPELLARLGLLGPPHAAMPDRYHAGPRLAQLLCLLGCSPDPGAAIEIELAADRPEITIIGIDAGLAVPSDELLNTLAETGSAWRWRSGEVRT